MPAPDDDAMKDTSRASTIEVGEHLTFGRRPWRLFRVWVLQIVLLFSEVEFLGVFHPWPSVHGRHTFVLWAYLLVTLGSTAALVRVVQRMAQLTFAPWSRHPRHLALSVAGYLFLGAVVVGGIGFLSHPTMAPDVQGGLRLPELALGAMASAVLALLLALGFYAQFDATDFPTQIEIDDAVRAWLRSLDWVEMTEGSWEKDRRYRAFEERSDDLARVLDNAVTAEGQALRDDFDEWLSWFRERDRLSQEAVIAGSVENERLDKGRARLSDITTRLKAIRNRS